jgi:hypothetical protein
VIQGGVVDSKAAAPDVDRSTSGREVVAESELMLNDKTAVADRSTLI